MNKSHALSNAKLGLLVISGLLFLIFSLYMIGKNQNIFGSSLRITAQVAEVNGLMPGNNVRFKGMDIGTVRQLRMHNDSVIEVHLLIQKSMAHFIQKNARTTINSDGLMGNKILQIHDQKGPSSPIEEGDVLYPLPQVTSEALWGKLDRSSESLESTLINLNTITTKLAQSKALWVLLSDPSIPSELKGTLEEFHRTANSATQVAEQGKAMVQQLQEGNGLVNKLFVDTLSAIQLENSLRQLELASL
ncbi:MAG: MCE family protein, partial [Cyclobacteriaceae bacterium]|nr:MCE family protein [Cyclobacteriaceae bacterium]